MDTVGNGFTVTITGLEGAEPQPFTTVITEKLPLVPTLMEELVWPPGLHWLPVVALETNTTESPSHRLTGPAGETVGAFGTGVTVTTTGVETADVHPFCTCMQV